ncbi:Vacuolar iron transporter-like 4 [Spatholobus suberectus]|nr:Vacuolar iron transporter-like 4 [Spatholobus suberectus]
MLSIARSNRKGPLWWVGTECQYFLVQGHKVMTIAGFLTLRRLRTAIFGASTGLVSKTFMIIVVGPVEQDTMAMIVSRFLAFVFLACSIATANVVSMSSQLDKKSKSWLNILDEIIVQAFAFVIGVMVPSFATSLIRKYKMGLGVVVATTSFALVAFGWLWAVLGKALVWKSVMMFLVGGWIFMVLPLGLNMFGKVDFW